MISGPACSEPAWAAVRWPWLSCSAQCICIGSWVWSQGVHLQCRWSTICTPNRLVYSALCALPLLYNVAPRFAFVVSLLTYHILCTWRHLILFCKGCKSYGCHSISRGLSMESLSSSLVLSTHGSRASL